MAEKASIILAAEDRTKAAFASVQSNLAGLGTGAEALVGRFTGVAAALTAALSAVQFRSSINGLDALNDAADATGSTIENLSALEDTAARTGTSFDTVTTALVKFNQALNAADPDSKVDKALKAIGLSAGELKQLDPSEALLKTATALAGYADDGNKARLVQELFGKSIREVAPLLKDLADKGTLVATVTTAQAAEAEKFNKQLDALAKNSTDAARSLVSDLLPALNRFAERVAGLKAGGGFFSSIGKEINANLLTEQLNSAVADLETVEKRIAFGEGGLDRRRSALRAYISDTQRQLLAATDALKGFAAAAAPLQQRGRPANEGGGRIITPSISVPASAGPVPRSAAKLAEPFVGPLPDAALTSALKRLEQTDTAKLAALNAELAQLFTIASGSGADGRVSDALRQVSDEIAKLQPMGPDLPASLKDALDRIDKVRNLRAELQALINIGGSNPTGAIAEAIGLVTKKVEELDPKLQRLNQLLADTDAGQLEKARADMQLLADALQAGTINAEQFADAANRRLGNELPKNLEKAKSLSEELGLSFSSAFEDAIVNGGKLSDVLAGLEKDILRILARKFVTNPIADGIGELIKGFLPSAKGNVFSGAPGLSAYSGSVVSSPTLFPFARGVGLMGEAGPEAILPLKRGPRGVLGVEATQAAAGDGVSIVINEAPPGTTGSVQRGANGNGLKVIVDIAKKAARADLVQDLSSGGSISGLVNAVTGTSRPTKPRT